MIFVGAIGATLYTSFNVVLLGVFEPSAEVAHFGAAERVVRVSLTVLGPIGIAVFPRLVALHSAGNRERARQLLIVMIAAAAVPALFITAGLALFAPTVIGVIYGRQFVDAAVPILRVLVLVIPVGVTAVAFGAWLIMQHKDRVAVVIVLRAGLVNVVLGCLLTVSFGPIGMAWSVVVAEATVALGLMLAVRRDGRGATVPAAPASSQPPQELAPVDGRS
jgi:PST family polysaccharide transporter